ncbi:MAG: isopeptide-forming domain-containing fimbrial protein [Methylotenera sp.]|nr:isopeptide-forming domain-containing fimbrial protein [Methylotenera sp.]
MFKLPFFTLSLALFALCCQSALATGTAAGLVITNSVVASYSIGAVAQPDITSNTASFTVDELIDLTLTWQDGAPVNVNSPDINDALTFLLTNTGNGQEKFNLTRNNAMLGDNYNPLNGTAGSIFIENGLQAGFQSSGFNADTLYISGVNEPNLVADASVRIYVNSDTPNSLTNGNVGDVQLHAASATTGAAGATSGTTLAGLGTSGTDAVVGNSSAQVDRVGRYIASGLSVQVSKTASCTPAPANCSKAAAGTIITYTLQVALAGAGAASNLIITDPLPAELTYIANSLKVGSVSKTDAADADNGQFVSNTMTVDLGSPIAPNTFSITFNAKIN